MNGPNGYLLGGPTGQAVKRPGTREFLVDADGDGYSHEVTGSAVSALTIELPVALQRCKRIHFEYSIVCDNADGMTSLALRPNGISANQYALQDMIFAGGASRLVSAITLLNLGGCADANTVLLAGYGHLEIATGGTRRHFAAIGSTYVTTPRIERRFNTSGIWDDTTTVVSSLQFFGAGTNGIRVGSRIRLFAEE